MTSQLVATDIKCIVERFPDRVLTIKRLVMKSERFRAICEDYAAGVEALGRWAGSSDHGREAQELRASLTELEDEIRTALTEDADRKG